MRVRLAANRLIPCKPAFELGWQALVALYLSGDAKTNTGNDSDPFGIVGSRVWWYDSDCLSDEWRMVA